MIYIQCAENKVSTKVTFLAIKNPIFGPCKVFRGGGGGRQAKSQGTKFLILPKMLFSFNRTSLFILREGFTVKENKLVSGKSSYMYGLLKC